jgi:hypothetical protein
MEMKLSSLECRVKELEGKQESPLELCMRLTEMHYPKKERG